MKNLVKKTLAVVLSLSMVITGLTFTKENTKAAVANVANVATSNIFMTSNANTPVEGFLTVGNGFSAINSCNESLTNGNNLLGQTATTDEVAIYIDLGKTYDISSALVYQGSTNNNFYDSYCTSYNVYYSAQQVSATNKGQIEWNLAGSCVNGSIYSGAKIKNAANVSDTGDAITFDNVYSARSVKVVFDKFSCMGTGTGGNETGTVGTVSLLSVRVYGEEKNVQPEQTTVVAPQPTTNPTYTEPDDGKDPTNVLFIGNSMTYYNTLAGVVKGIAAIKGHNINTTAATNGGKNLIFQSTADNILNAIKVGGYDVVVLQDIVGSFNANNLQTGADAIIPTIKQYNPNAKIIFYEPWPTKDTISGDDSKLPYFTESYIATAKKANAKLAPAGEAFYEIYTTYGLDYYCGDQKHPQPLGTFISASSVYYTLYPNEAYKEYTAADQTSLDTVINNNVAYTNEGVLSTYNLNTLNLINQAGYKYSHAVAPAVAGVGTYKSVGEYVSPLDQEANPNELAPVQGTVVNANVFSTNNLALGKATKASTGTAANAVDGVTTSRWESASADPQWLYVDLGSAMAFDSVGFMWEGAYAKKYYIQTSDDATNWTTIAYVTADSAKTVQIDLDKTYTARYVRMYGTKRGTGYGYSFYEMGIWNKAGAPNPTTNPNEVTTVNPNVTTAAGEVTTKAPVGEVSEIVFTTQSVTPINGDFTNRAVAFNWNAAPNATKYTVYVGADETGAIAKAYHNNYSFSNMAQKSADHIRAAAGTTSAFTVVGYDADNNIVAKGTINIDVPALTDEEIADSQIVSNINSDKNLALTGTPFVSSKTGKNITDGNMNSSWQADPKENPNDDPTVEAFGVDLGSVKPVDTVVIAWENSYATAYDIYVAGADGVYGETPVASDVASGNNPVVITKFNQVNAQYVKVVPTALSGNAKTYGTCVFELAVMALGAPEQVTTVAPTQAPTTVAPTTVAPTTTQAPTTTVAPTTTTNEVTTVAPVIVNAPTELSIVKSENNSYTLAWAAMDPSQYTSFNIYIDGEEITSVVGFSAVITADKFDGPGTHLVGVQTALNGKASSITMVQVDIEADVTTTEASTDAPTVAPTTTQEPTDAPTVAPTTTQAPTDAPTTTQAPTDAPTVAPTTTQAPTDAPTVAPTTTQAPTDEPTTVAPTTAEVTTVAPTTVETTTIVETTTTEKVTSDDAVNVKKPAKVKISKIAKKKKSAKKVVVTIKKLTGVNGYQVYVLKSKKTKKAVVSKIIKKNAGKLSVTSKKLKNKKILFVKVRAFVLSNGSPVYGAWSKPKKVKVK